MMNNVIGRLRLIGLVEGTSFLVLLLIAMPLKYLAGMPMAVKVVGWAHGVLFVLYGVAALQAVQVSSWSVVRTLLVLLAAVVPGGPFLLDGWLRKEQQRVRD